ncbi:MAG: hypothetical protein H6657_26470 [Ardenticatenaceae bacterium]|nr:hypothetical protein [Ardenticatenaceae bacterium]
MANYLPPTAPLVSDGGMGDIPPPPIWTLCPRLPTPGQMMGDNYLFWRASLKEARDDPSIPRLCSLAQPSPSEQIAGTSSITCAPGQRRMAPDMGGRMGGAYDPEAEATRQAEMLDLSRRTSVLTQAEADLFADIHAQLDTNMTSGQGCGQHGQMQSALLTTG